MYACVSGGGGGRQTDRQTETHRDRERDRDRQTETDQSGLYVIAKSALTSSRRTLLLILCLLLISFMSFQNANVSSEHDKGPTISSEEVPEVFHWERRR